MIIFFSEIFMERDPLIIGNWKMYKTAQEAEVFIKELAPMIGKAMAEVGLAVPFTSIARAYEAAKNTNILIGAQNMNDHREGAYTGEISAIMLKEAGASFVLLGHSERRHLYREEDESINLKVLRALADDLQPILCVGETEEQRERAETPFVLKEQIFRGLREVPMPDAEKVVIAYEPVWAIGTGRAATPQIAQDAHRLCKEFLYELFGKNEIRVIYGGSVKPENIGGFMEQKEIDGALVGGASLDPLSFAKIVNF
jgi:triosephosphate isomerase (TIM)